MQGHCTCNAVTYRLTKRPLFTHCCHCTWCQRETGSAFALNAMIETECLSLTGPVDEIVTPSASGKGQIILRCQLCKVALCSHYAGAGRAMAFVRVGTLDDPAACPPDIHIFTSTKLPWVTLDPSLPILPEYYDRKVYWPKESLDRRAALLARIAQ
ncbi:aldehyde-activating protein [bacterium]|nr:aldehyde-activating protein [bacterium]